MSDVAVQEILETLLEQNFEGDTNESTEVLHFLVRSLRDPKLAAVAAHGISKLMNHDARYRGLFKALGVEAAVQGLHFLGSEISDLATGMAEELQQDPPAEVLESWKTFSFESSERSQTQSMTLRVKLSRASDARRLSSHGWRIWPGAQILSRWLVSKFSTLENLDVIEAARNGDVFETVLSRVDIV